MDVDERHGNGKGHIGNQELRLRVAENEIHLAADEGIIYRHDDRAEADDCHVYIHELCAVRCVQAYRIAAADAHGIQRVPVIFHCFFKLAVSDIGFACHCKTFRVCIFKYFMNKHRSTSLVRMRTYCSKNRPSVQIGQRISKLCYTVVKEIMIREAL